MYFIKLHIKLYIRLNIQNYKWQSFPQYRLERAVYHEMLRMWIPSRGWRPLGGSPKQQLSQPVLQLHGK